MHGKESDRKGPTIRGITFTQYAYRAIDIEGKKPATLVSEEPTDDPIGPPEPGTYGREVVGTTLENVTISFCSRVGGYFRGDGLVLRNSLISDTSTEGFYVIGSSDVLLERNIFRRNNVEELTGYYPAAVKIFNQSHRVTVRDNLVIDNPHSNGIWYDVGNRDGVFVNNWVEGALVGFFFEISHGSDGRRQRVRGLRQGRVGPQQPRRARLPQHVRRQPSASFERNERSAVGDHFGWHPRTGPDVDEREGHVFVGNLLVASESFRKPLLRFEQPRAPVREAHPAAGDAGRRQRLRARGDERAAGRVGPGGGRATLPGRRSPRSRSCASSQPTLEARGRVVAEAPSAVFRSPELRRLDLARPLPGAARPRPAADGRATSPRLAREGAARARRLPGAALSALAPRLSACCRSLSSGRCLPRGRRC